MKYEYKDLLNFLIRKDNKIYIEEAEDMLRESPTYKKILEHRKECSKWGKEFCLECFGGGLTLFLKGIREELMFKSKEDWEKENA